MRFIVNIIVRQYYGNLIRYVTTMHKSMKYANYIIRMGFYLFNAIYSLLGVTCIFMRNELILC